MPRSRKSPVERVGYSAIPSCLNGNAYWSMLIRLRPSKRAAVSFVQVAFSLPCGKEPKWVLAVPPSERFRVVRLKECDEAVLTGTDRLEQLRNTGSCAPELTCVMPLVPLWVHPPGTESIALPFGQVVPCYSSVDLPSVPFL